MKDFDHEFLYIQSTGRSRNHRRSCQQRCRLAVANPHLMMSVSKVAEVVVALKPRGSMFRVVCMDVCGNQENDGYIRRGKIKIVRWDSAGQGTNWRSHLI